MRLFLSKLLVLSLLLITMHSVVVGEHTTIPVDGFTSIEQAQAEAILVADNGQLPPDNNIASSECNLCHSVHILLMFAPDELSLARYSNGLKNTGKHLTHSYPLDDIPHPPIILI
jgi:hypothetical protein